MRDYGPSEARLGLCGKTRKDPSHECSYTTPIVPVSIQQDRKLEPYVLLLTARLTASAPSLLTLIDQITWVVEHKCPFANQYETEHPNGLGRPRYFRPARSRGSLKSKIASPIAIAVPRATLRVATAFVLFNVDMYHQNGAR